MRVSGLGVVPASFDPKTNTVSYQVTKKLRDKCSVIVEAKAGGKKVEAHWTFAVEEGARRQLRRPVTEEIRAWCNRQILEGHALSCPNF